jgi:hypothetical protein
MCKNQFTESELILVGFGSSIFSNCSVNHYRYRSPLYTVPVLGVHRILIWQDNRPFGYLANSKAGYQIYDRIFGEADRMKFTKKHDSTKVSFYIPVPVLAKAFCCL